MKKATAIATRFILASGLCLTLASFAGVGANAQGKMKNDKPMKMSKPMMKSDDMMMDGDHGMGMMMDTDDMITMTSYSGYPYAAPGSLTACSYSDMCDMMSMREEKMMHGGHMMTMMEDDPMMMDYHHMMSMHNYPLSAPGALMSYDEHMEMMHGEKNMGKGGMMGKDGMMMHDDSMMDEEEETMFSPGYPYAAPGSLSSYSENYEKREMADHKMMSGDRMDKPMKMKKEMKMKKGM